MAPFTQKAIIDSFLKLLNQTPLSRITVKDIVEDCGISRNTFYYHFADIYALVEAAFHQELARCAELAQAADTNEEACMITVNFLSDSAPALRHIYSSLSRDYLERYLFDVLDRPLLDFVRGVAAEMDIPPAEDAINFVAKYQKYALAGFILDWLNQGANSGDQDLHYIILRMMQLFQNGVNGSLRKMLELYIDVAPMPAESRG